MAIPSFVGPLVSGFLFLSTVFGICFYYCYFKPKRQRKNNTERTTANQESPSFSSSCPSRSRAAKKSLNDEERSYGYNSGLSAYSAAYCFHGGFPMVNPSCEQIWQPPIRKMKYQATALCKTQIEQHAKPDRACCELRVDMLKERTVKPCISRQLSSESRGSRKVCHLQVIQECECEEEKEESEETSQVNNKDLESGKCNIVT